MFAIGKDLWDRASRAFARTEKTQLLLRGTFSSLVLRGFAFALRFAVGLLLARFLGPAGYGEYSFAVTWLALLAIPTTLGMEHIVLRFVPAYREVGAWSTLRGLLQTSNLAGLVASVAVVVLAGVAVATLPGQEPEQRLTFWITFAVLPAVVLGFIRQSTLRGFDRPVLAQLPENVIYPACLLVLISVWHFLVKGILPVSAAAIANAAAWTLAFASGTYLVRRMLPRSAISGTATFERLEWFNMVPSLVFVGLAYHLMSRADVLVLGALGSSHDVGLYAVASRGGELMLFMYDAITLAAASLFSSIYATGDRTELQRFTSLATSTILWITLPVYLIALVGAPWFLGLFGPEFVEATAAMRLLTTTYFISTLGGFVIVMLYMTGHQRDVAIAMAIGAGTNVVLSIFLVPHHGVLGAAIASGITLVALKTSLVLILYLRTGVISLPVPFRLVQRLQGSA